jgi:hypothetical protein
MLGKRFRADGVGKAKKTLEELTEMTSLTDRDVE